MDDRLKNALGYDGVTIESVGRRLNRVCAYVGSRRTAATLMGVSEDMVHRYCSAKTRPPFIPLAELARQTGVRLEWLAFGDEPMLKSEEATQSYDPEASIAFDSMLMSNAIEILESVLLQMNIELEPSVKARMLSLLYQYARNTASVSERHRFAQDLVSSL